MQYNGYSIAEIEATYKQASKGNNSPEVIMIICQKCGRGYTLVKGGSNEVCSHLKEMFNESNEII